MGVGLTSRKEVINRIIERVLAGKQPDSLIRTSLADIAIAE